LAWIGTWDSSLLRLPLSFQINSPLSPFLSTLVLFEDFDDFDPFDIYLVFFKTCTVNNLPGGLPFQHSSSGSST
jgi:hypothetical protein